MIWKNRGRVLLLKFVVVEEVWGSFGIFSSSQEKLVNVVPSQIDRHTSFIILEMYINIII